MKKNGITRDGFVFDNFDEVDIAMMVDKSLDDALDGLNFDAETSKDPMGLDPFEEASMSDKIDDFSDVNIPKEVVHTKMDPIEAEASEYIDAYNDLYGAMDYGDMIDIVAGR